MEIRPCDRCGKTRILTARVKSDILNMAVCSECGVLAAKLLATLPGVDGELAVEEIGPYTSFMLDLARN